MIHFRSEKSLDETSEAYVTSRLRGNNVIRIVCELSAGQLIDKICLKIVHFTRLKTTTLSNVCERIGNLAGTGLL